MRTLTIGRGAIRSLAFAPDGRSLACAHEPDVSIVPLDGGPVRRIRRGGRSRSLTFAPDGRLAWWEPVGVWMWDGGEESESVEWADALPAALIAVAWHEGELFTIRQELKWAVWDRRQFRAAVCNPSGKGMAVAGRRLAVLRVCWERGGWPRKSGAIQVEAFDLADLPPTPTGEVAAGHRYPTRDDPMMGRVQVPRPRLECRRTTLATSCMPAFIALAADGGSVLVADDDRKTVRWFDAVSGEERAAWVWPAGAVMSLAFAPDGLTAAVGGLKGRVILWDLA